MKKQQLLNRLKTGAAPLVLSLAVVASPAYAQTTDSTQADSSQSDSTQTDDQSAVETGPVAQANTNAQGAETTGGDIIVTGSRIPQPNLDSASPVTVINSQEIQQTGTTRVEDLVNSLPQTFASQGSSYANGASGAANINLRGLGAERTLVLVNGRRVIPGDPNTSAADINLIPSVLIKRFDVLTGGASSVYGADAVSGVVNFVMDTDFTGVKLDGQYSLYQHDNRAGPEVTGALNESGYPYPGGVSANGEGYDVTAAFGAGFDDDRGHITAYFGYRNIAAVRQNSRDYSSCALAANGADSVANGGGLFACSGSGTTALGDFRTNDGGDDIFTLAPNNDFTPGFTPYNYGPLNYYQRPDERYTAGFFAHYDVSDSIEAYGEFMFMDDQTVAQIAPSGDFGNTLSINCDNPLLSAQQLSIACAPNNLLTTPGGDTVYTDSQNPDQAARPAVDFIDPVTGNTYNRGALQILRRNVEGGPRQDDLQHTDYRFVGGIRGDLDPVWSYDAYYQYGRVNFSETYNNDFSINRLTKSLDVVSDPDSGDPVCRSSLGANGDADCVPYNIFSRGGVSDAAIGYLVAPGFQRGINEETVVSGSVTGQLGQYGIASPLASEGVSVVFGAEYRKESLDFDSDLEFRTGDLAGQGAPTLPVNGSFDVKELFTEVRLPLVHDNFIYDLNLTGGYRYSDYDNGSRTFSTDTYKIQGEFAPIRDIRFRGGYNRAVRAPTVQDQFSPQYVALDGSTDPCAGILSDADPDNDPSGSLAGCQAQGVTAAQFGAIQPNPAGQYNGLIGGNANLDPEVADTYTAGVILQPRFVPALSISVDYFNISLDQAIQGIGADTILNACDTTQDPQFCNLINRDQFGSLWRTPNGYVTDTTQNIGGVSTDGIDVDASYSREFGGIGQFGLNFNGTYLNSLETDTGLESAGSFDCKGYYGAVCGTPNPEWRHQLRLTYTSPNGIGAYVRWRYFDGVDQDAASSNPNLSSTVQPGNAHIPSQSFFDVNFSFSVAEHYQFRLGANNVLDREPPLVGSQACPAGPCNGNTYAQVYDALGRYIYAGVKLDF